MESDISQLEAPTFTTLPGRSQPEPMTKLKWNHKVSLIGEKVLNPMIHCCDQCLKPILIYGRMIPCKHVFCLKCAREEPSKACPRCKEKVVRVEQSGLGTVFMCSHGGSRYGNTGCRRTYLSQRDLQAHINHRHNNGTNIETKPQQENKVNLAVQKKPPSEQTSNRQNARPPPHTSTQSVPPPPVSTPSAARNLTSTPNMVHDSHLHQPQKQPLMPPMMANMSVQQQPPITTVPELYYNTTMATQPQPYTGYANPNQQPNVPGMQPNYGSMHQQNPGMSMMMSHQAVHMSRPPPPQGSYYPQYGQPYGHMPQHYPNPRYEQQNFHGPSNAQQWNQQQYYR